MCSQSEESGSGEGTTRNGDRSGGGRNGGQNEGTGEESGDADGDGFYGVVGLREADLWKLMTPTQ